MKEITDKSHWENVYEETNFLKVPEDSIIFKLIKDKLKQENVVGKTSFEVGIYPGSYSTIFGSLGYQINGIDRIKEVDSDMKNWMVNEGFSVGDLICGDFFEYDYKKKYDLVSSFGFIEHFENFEEVIKKHCDLVSEKGYLIIEVPNFRGYVQFLIKRLLDKKNLDIHYVKSMNFKKWRKVLIEKDFEIISEDYIGGFSLDLYEQDRNFIQKKVIQLIKRYRYFIKKHIFKGQSKHYSSVMMMIAKKK